MTTAGSEPRPAHSDSPPFLEGAGPYPADIHAQFHKCDPYRQPNWRWDWARRLLESNRQPDPVWDGPFIKEGMEYQWFLQNKPEADLAELMPALHRTHRIYTSTRMLRWEVEARILAREPFGAIAEKTCQTVEVIEMYEALFFNVLDRINVPYYIVHQAVRATHVFDPTKPGVIWRFFAYHAGTAVLDALMSHFLALPGPDYTCLLDGFLTGTKRTKLERAIDACLRGMFFKVTDDNALDFFDTVAASYEAGLAKRFSLPAAEELRDQFYEKCEDLFEGNRQAKEAQKEEAA